MWLSLALFVLTCCAPVAFCDASDETPGQKFKILPGDVRNCPSFSPQNVSQPLHRMEVLPGLGFDNLRNLDMGQVHFYNYSTCRISADGKYLLPDNIFLIPVQQSEVDVFAEVFDHWDEYTSMTSHSINVDASFSYSAVSAKFSTDYTTTKTHQANSGKNTKTARVQIRHKLYTVKIQPDAQLHPTFKARLFDIAANLQSNNTEFAHYLAELLVRDYGTHYVSSIDAGATLAQIDQGTWDYGFTEDTKTTNLKIAASASANFFAKVSFSTTFTDSTSTDDKNAFTHNRTHSKVVTVGGPPFRPDFTYDDWENGVADAMVAIDRSGDPLHFAITPATISDLPEESVRRVADTVYRAVKRYYKVNTRRGCTDPNSPNFQFQANIDDGKCKPLQTNFSFGGIYQTCRHTFGPENLCEVGAPADHIAPANQVNPLTGIYSCPSGYMAVLLHEGSVTHMKNYPVCHTHCKSWCWSHCCKTHCIDQPFLSGAEYQAYWCVATGEVPANSGYLFGGFYTRAASNPFSGSMTCPQYFIPLHFAEDITVCVSSDYELGNSNAVPFGGFQSCVTGNPLAAAPKYASDQTKWPHDCPHGYMQHLVTVDEGCEINFCVVAGAFKTYSVHPPKLPPFRKHPKYKMNVTNTLIIFGLYGNVWAKNQNGEWETTSIEKLEADGVLTLETLIGNSTTIDPNAIPLSSIGSSTGPGKSLPSGAVAAVSVVSTLVLCTAIVVVVFVGCSCVKRRRRSKMKASSYIKITDAGASESGSTASPNSNDSQV